MISIRRYISIFYLDMQSIRKLIFPFIGISIFWAPIGGHAVKLMPATGFISPIGKRIIPSLQQPVVYSAKFICGPQTKPATAIGQITTFAPLQPGNYATALNVLPLLNNLPAIEVFVAMNGVPGNPLVKQFTPSQAFETFTLGCDEILKSLAVTVNNEAYEGFLYITRMRPDLDVQAVYTYASRDVFEFMEFRGVDKKGNVVINPEVGVTSIGGAGGGGLGLGASIDVERIEPIHLK